VTLAREHKLVKPLLHQTADELIFASELYDHALRLRSFEIAEEVTGGQIISSEGRRVADIVPRDIFGITTFGPRNSHIQRGLRYPRQSF
jgi:hypothetical protein